MGRGTDPLDQLVISGDLPPAPRIPALAPGKLLERRPDVRASKADMIAAMQARGHQPVDDNEADALALLYLALKFGDLT